MMLQREKGRLLVREENNSWQAVCIYGKYTGKA